MFIYNTGTFRGIRLILQTFLWQCIIADVIKIVLKYALVLGKLVKFYQCHAERNDKKRKSIEQKNTCIDKERLFFIVQR